MLHPPKRNAAHRQSVLELDAFSNHDESSSSTKSWSDGSLSSPECSYKNNLTTSYNCGYLRNFLQNGMRIPSEDINRLRREVMDEYFKQRSDVARRKCIEEAVRMLSILKQQAVRIPSKDDTEFPYFLLEYQEFVHSVYSTIRLETFSTDLPGHFAAMKDHQLVIIGMLPRTAEHQLLPVVRFSLLCVEFNCFCDEQCLNIFRNCYSYYSAEIAKGKMSRKRQDKFEEMRQKREEEHKIRLLRDLNQNIQEIQLALTLHLTTSARRKKEMLVS